MVVTPMEVVKIRLQAQMHSLADPLEVPKYRNAAHAVYTIVREEGFAALYRGISLTALRQATNQGKALSPQNDFHSPPSLCRSEFYRLPRAKEGRPSMATRSRRSAILPAHGHWLDFGSDGTFLKRTNRHN
jgi:hypothetical protein